MPTGKVTGRSAQAGKPARQARPSARQSWRRRACQASPFAPAGGSTREARAYVSRRARKGRRGSGGIETGGHFATSGSGSGNAADQTARAVSSRRSGVPGARKASGPTPAGRGRPCQYPSPVTPFAGWRPRPAFRPLVGSTEIQQTVDGTSHARVFGVCGKSRMQARCPLPPLLGEAGDWLGTAETEPVGVTQINANSGLADGPYPHPDQLR